MCQVNKDRSYHLLVVADSSNVTDQLAAILRDAGVLVRIQRLESTAEMELVLRTEQRVCWDLILANANVHPLHALALLRHAGTDIPLIVLTEGPADGQALEAFSYGARDVVGLDEPRLVHVILRELGDADWRRTLGRVQSALQETEQRADALIDTARDPIAYIHEGMHVYANPVYLKMLGFDSLEDLQGVPMLDIIAPEDHDLARDVVRSFGQQQQAPVPRKIGVRNMRGQVFRVSMEMSSATHSGEHCIQVVFHEESDDRAVQEKISRLKELDPLTGLYNRQYLLQAIAQAIEAAVKGGGDSSLLYVELDDPEAIVTSVGIPNADRMLSEVAQLVKSHLGGVETLARFGDYVFCLLMETDDLEQAKALAERVRAAVEDRVFEVEGNSAVITCTVGVCLITGQTHNVHEAILAAQTASSEGRQRGGNQVAVHKGSWQEYAEDKQWPKRIRQALADNRFRLFFQPVVTLHGELQQMYEVLLRMFDEGGNMVLPEQFLSRAVEADLLPALDRWVVEHTLQMLEQERATGKSLSVFIRLSDRSLTDRALLDWFVEQAKAGQIPADRIIFEVSEATAAIQLRYLTLVTAELKPLRFRFALSHFGHRSQSFGLLKHLHVDFVKIDGALVRYLTRDSKAQAAVHSIIEAAHGMGILTVAEDLEDAETLAMLWQYRVDYARGYYIQIPTERPEFDFLANL